MIRSAQTLRLPRYLQRWAFIPDFHVIGAAIALGDEHCELITDTTATMTEQNCHKRTHFLFLSLDGDGIGQHGGAAQRSRSRLAAAKHRLDYMELTPERKFGLQVSLGRVESE